MWKEQLLDVVNGLNNDPVSGGVAIGAVQKPRYEGSPSRVDGRWTGWTRSIFAGIFVVPHHRVWRYCVSEERMKRTTVAALAVVGAVVIGGSAARTYSVQMSPIEAQLIWNGNEAYVAIAGSKLGWRRSPFRLLVDRFMVTAKYGAPAQAQRRSSVLFRMAPTTVDQNVTDIDVRTRPTLSVVDGQVSDYFCRWTGARFEPITAEQKQRVMPFPTADFSGVDGWSGQRFSPDSPAPSGRRIPFTLGERPMTLILFGEMLTSAVIDLQRGDLPPERLWSLDGRSRFVSKS
jgi:hypothetical protein